MAVDKSLKQLEEECAAWRALSFGMVTLGEGVLTLKALALEKGWTDTAEDCETFAQAIANALEGNVLPAVESHHVEHHAAVLAVAELERGLEAS